jgi:F-box/leucine-rich repeat protein 2/20
MQFEDNNKLSEEYSAVLPLSNVLGANEDGNYNRKVRQIGEVSYSPPNEGEEMRHLKKLPNTVID